MSTAPDTLRLVSRASELARVQVDIAAQQIQQAFPTINIETIALASAGDHQLSAPLYELEGRDFFTKGIDEQLLDGHADLAVHSLKDLSVERAEDLRFYAAIFQRDDPRDVVLFLPSVLDNIKHGKPITLGTSSLRRQELVPPLLRQLLPIVEGREVTEIHCESIRGNVDTRLNKLRAGEFDGIVLAAAGLNRLLRAPQTHTETSSLLAGLKIMLLPLVECTPAPAQGALVIEALATNSRACEVVERLRNAALEKNVARERALLREFGGGCHQRFGGVYLSHRGVSVLAVAGLHKDGSDVTELRFSLDESSDKVLSGRRLFSASDFMKDFFVREPVSFPHQLAITEQAVFVSNHRVVQHPQEELWPELLRQKRVWTAGTRSWIELARRGVWVEGSSDGFGLEFLDAVLPSPLVGLGKQETLILTNTASAERWKADGRKALGTYTLRPNLSEGVRTALQSADAFFWTGFEQYDACREFLPEGSIHICPAGKTADLLRAEGVELILFPTIKTFLTWRTQHHDTL